MVSLLLTVCRNKIEKSQLPDLSTPDQQPEPENNLIGDENQKAGHAQIRVDHIQQDPTAGEDATPRESIEVRTLAFF